MLDNAHVRSMALTFIADFIVEFVSAAAVYLKTGDLSFAALAIIAVTALRQAIKHWLDKPPEQNNNSQEP